jgi:hypothetical protein
MAPVAKKELPPGDSTVVELIFGTKTTKGKVTKNAVINSTDSSRASITIDFTANIVPDSGNVSKVKFNPSRMDITSDIKKFVVTVQNDSGTNVRLTMLAPPSDEGLKAKIKDSDIKVGKNGKIEFEWKGSEPEFDINHIVTFETNNPAMPRFSIPYTIKGTKGPKPGTQPQHAETKPVVAKPSDGQPPVMSKPPIQNKIQTDTTNIRKSIAPANWPPK